MTMRIKGARMNPAQRKEQILNTAIDVCMELGYRQLTRRAVANRMQCASALINHYFDSIENLRESVLLIAIEKELLPILAENYTAWNEKRLELPQQLKEKVIQYITN